MNHDRSPERASPDERRAAGADHLEGKRFYTVAQAAALLGLSAPTLYREIRAGRFPAIRVRSRYVIPAKAVDAIEQAALEGGVVDPVTWASGPAAS